MAERELSFADVVEGEGSIEEVANTLVAASPVERIIRASADIASSIGKLVLNGNAGEAVKESANRLS